VLSLCTQNDVTKRSNKSRRFPLKDQEPHLRALAAPVSAFLANPAGFKVSRAPTRDFALDQSGRGAILQQSIGTQTGKAAKSAADEERSQSFGQSLEKGKPMLCGTIFRFVIVASLCVVVVGCATSRSEIKLSGATAGNSLTTAAAGKTVVVRAVTDERVFEEAPSDPSIPSLGFEGAATASTDVKARAIGRKRNSYGKALGDILLESGQTVEGVVREHLTVALKQAGYELKPSNSDAASTPLVLDVHIKQFWAWLQPGFWAITLSAKIAVDLDVAEAATPTRISVIAEDSRQVASDSAWMEIVDKALRDFRVQVTTKFASRP